MLGWLPRVFSLRRQTAQPDDPQTTRAYYTRGAGIYINPDVALTYSVVWACVGYISRTIAYLPWTVQRRGVNAKGRVAVENLLDHTVSKILRRNPNPEMTSFAFRETLLHWALLWGDGYAEIQRTMDGRAYALWPIDPTRVEPKRDRETGQLYYRITNGYSGNLPAFSEVPAEDIFHLHGLGFDGLRGYSPVAYAARSIGLGIAAETFGAAFYGNNAIPGGVLQHPSRISDEAAERLKKSWEQSLGGAAKSNKTVVLEEGMEWKPTVIPPEQAQFLGTRQFSVAEICRWFGLPPTKVADLTKSTYNNVEHLNREVVNDALMPWITRLEEEADTKMLSRGFGGLRSHVNVNSLLRGDSDSRAKHYKEMFGLGALSPNEIREMEGLNPIPGGDRYFVPTNNLTPLDRIDETIDNAAKPSPVEAGAAKLLEDTEEDEESKEAIKDVLKSVGSRR